MNRLHKTAAEIEVAEVPATGESADTQVIQIALPAGEYGAAIRSALEEIVHNDAIKVGRTISRANMERVQQMHDHTTAMGAVCQAKNAKSALFTKQMDGVEEEGGAGVSGAEDLGVPLDVLVGAVRDAFWNLRAEMRLAQRPAGADPYGWWEWDDDLCPRCEAVYDGYAIAQVGLGYYKVNYTVKLEGVVLDPQASWQQVTQEWVAKSIELVAFMKANAQAREVGAVKSLGGNRLGNYLIVWGDEEHRDLYGEFFTKSTQGLKAIFDHLGGKLPALYQHAADGHVKFSPVGTIDVLEPDEVGLWMETQLDLANQYADAVRKLAKKKALGSSSGALPGSRKVRPNGEIAQWAIIEGSFTPTPAEPRLRDLGVAEVKSIYEQFGFEFPEDTLKTGIGGEEPRQDDEAALELERLELLQLTLHAV